MNNALESAFTAKTRVGRKVEVWITLQDAAKILGVKIYTVRSLEWDNLLGERKTVGRRVYVEKSAVLTYAQQTRMGDSERTEMSRKEYGQTVLDAIQMVKNIVSQDKEVVDAKFRKDLDTMFDRYTTIATTMVK